MKPSKVAKLKPKKKCCKSKTRCKCCPIVVSKVKKACDAGVCGKDLEKVFKQARQR
ncbi:hypothetical protein [Mycolicibacterium fallax]|uniref:hypothetical protein n=1 Tax=Mycolicibacterium fallax TaxID=1793 RepID=UPI00138D7F11|nr:hypothetical protein [Mycolicibacterium fallax]BBZ00376.1 hypothetical protein MFAL_38420 [Mycolicibacterium fallax]HSA41122.1 hypothetical protein [Mycobacterium sp.]